MESTYVHNTYKHIASHFDETRKAIWKCVGAFMDSIPSHSIIADVGCGNGKYTKYRKDIFTVANDVCFPLLEIVGKSHSYDTLMANGLILPYKHNTFDFAISIAVLHHISTYDDRLCFIKNIINILKPNGKLLFTVWAEEQNKKSKWVHHGNNDYFIPWLDKETQKVYQRFYHLFSKAEITKFIEDLKYTHNINIKSVEYERDNWCVTLVKV